MSVVVLLAQDNLMCAKKLLQEDHAGELVRQCDRAERETLLRLVAHPLAQPEWAADHEAEVLPGPAPLREELGQPLARAGPALPVEHAEKRARRNPPQDRGLL